MKLESLYTNLLDMSPIARMTFFDKLFRTRAYLADYNERIKHTKIKKVKKDPALKIPKRKIAVTPEELIMMRKLGLV
jgi:hypothetical protein